MGDDRRGGPRDSYRDPDPTRALQREAGPDRARRDGSGRTGRSDSVRDPVTGRPTAPRFLSRPPLDRGDLPPRDRADENADDDAYDRADAERSASSAPRSPRGPADPPPRAVSSAARTQPRPGTHHPDSYDGSSGRSEGRGVGVPGTGAPRAAGRGGSGRPPGPGARPGPGGPPRRRRRLRLLRTILLLLVIVLIGYPVSLAVVAWRHVGRTDPLPAAAATPGTTYLLVGSDSREGLDGDAVGYLNTGDASDVGGARTDTILLLHVPGGGQPPALVSIPRDSYVEIPGQGQNKINAAFAFGGAGLLAQTVTQATGLGIDSYVETGLGGFAGIADAIGGVDVCLPAPLQDPDAGIDLPAGCQVLDGGKALGVARSRKTDARGDLARVERQRAILAAIVDQAASPAAVLNPTRAYPLAAAGGSALTVDEGTGPVALGRFALAMRDVAAGNGITLTVPVSNANLQTDAGSSVEWDAAQSQQLWQALRSNDMTTVRAIAEAQDPAVEAPTRPSSR